MKFHPTSRCASNDNRLHVMQPSYGCMGNGVCTIMHFRSTWMLPPPAVQNRAASFLSHVPVQKLYAVPTSALPASCASIMSS